MAEKNDVADKKLKKQKKRQMFTLRVQYTQWLTDTMIRVVLEGDDLATFNYRGFTDSYVKLLFPKPDVAYPEPFDIHRIREELPRQQWPDTRTYTVRWFDPDQRRLALDFVTHGDSGLAGPWAQQAQPGDVLRLMGPGGAYAPRADVDRHLLVGDESALPAIAAGIEALPAHARAHAVIEVAGPGEHQPLPTDADLRVDWIHRDGAPYGEKLVAAVRALSIPDESVHAFVHGETTAIKRLRSLLRDDWAIPRERLSLSGYWRVGMNEDGFQAAKRTEAEAERGQAPAERTERPAETPAEPSAQATTLGRG